VLRHFFFNLTLGRSDYSFFINFDKGKEDGLEPVAIMMFLLHGFRSCRLLQHITASVKEPNLQNSNFILSIKYFTPPDV
jgi:hypothetical protein